MDPTTLQQYMTFIDTILNDAGKVMKEGFYGPQKVFTKTAPWDLVTDYDKKVENIIASAIKTKYPNHLIIAEEDAADRKLKCTALTDDPTWLIDPIDGTQNYVRGIAESCISAALAIQKQLVVAIVYNPVSEDKYTAIKGQGAFRNGRSIRVSKANELDGGIMSFELLAMRFPGEEERNKNRILALSQKLFGFRAIGSAAMTLCLVAAGGIDAMFLELMQCWDIAAGVLIVQEAGGYVCSTDGTEVNLFEKKILAAANKKIADEIIVILKQYP